MVVMVGCGLSALHSYITIGVTGGLWKIVSSQTNMDCVVTVTV